MVVFIPTGRLALDDIHTRMYHDTLLKLPFTDGYYCFKEKVFVPEQVDCMARVPYKFPKRDDAIIAEIQKRVLRPIFNGDEALQRAVLCYIARKMAGHVEEKLYAVCIGKTSVGLPAGSRVCGAHLSSR
eukprot:COSAG02_NODE_15555_length_1160_cov_2.561734_1_plen_128_part_10